MKCYPIEVTSDGENIVLESPPEVGSDQANFIVISAEQADLVVRWIIDCKKDVEKEASKL